MRFLRGMFATAMIVCFPIAATVAGLAQTQSAAEPAQAASPAPAASLTSSPAESTPAKKIYIVPAGTKVLLQLRSGINTRSAKSRRWRLPCFDFSGRGRKQSDDSVRSLRAGNH